MAADDDGTGAFRGASFTGADFTGANFRDCDLRQVKITDSWLVDVSLSGLIGNLVVNDVDVTAFVEGELDRRHPERVQLRDKRTAGDYRAMWDTIERLWAGTLARAGRLPEPALHQRVDGEWSFIETLRHLVFATDAWVRRALLGEPSPWDPLDLPHDEMPDEPSVPRDRAARPTLDQVLALRADRMATVRQVIADLTDEQLAGRTAPVPEPGYPEPESFPVRRCLQAILSEEWQHRLYAERDLAALESQP